MKFWLIGIGESLPTEGPGYRRWRTGMLASALLARGHEVTWWTSSVDHFTKRQMVERDEIREISPGFRLEFIHGRLYRRNVSIARALNHADLARGFARLAAQRPRPDLVFTTFPPIELCLEAVRFSRRNSVASVVDINDLWPDEMWSRVPRLLRPLARVALLPMSSQVKRAMREATAVCGISRSYLRWAARHGAREGAAADAVFPLGYPDDAGSNAVQPVPVRQDGLKRFLFVGTFVRSIDLETVIDAARLLTSRPDIRVIIVGAGERDGALRARAAGLENVEFTGWATQQQIREQAQAAYAGLAAYVSGALMSLPNKIYEYLRFGLPILCALDGEARELVEGAGAGVAYRAGDSADLARVMQRLADDPQGRERMAAAARAAYESKFAESAVYPPLVQWLERLVADNRNSKMEQI